MMFFRFPFKPSGQRDGRFFSFGVPLRFVNGGEYAYWCDDATRASILKGRGCWGRDDIPVLLHAVQVEVKRIFGHMHSLAEVLAYGNATGQIGKVRTE